jgi:glycerol kinase
MTMSNSSVILAIDLGTTGNRAMAFTDSGTITARAYRKLTQYCPQAGWVEHDPIELYRTCRETIEEVIGKVGIENIHAAGITNQRETTIIWERSNGRPVYPAIVWQDRRTSPACDDLHASRDIVKNRTGLIIDPYFSATKIAWILDKVDPKRKRCARGELLFGTPETWVLWNLTGGAIHATEPSNASRTMLYNMTTQKWDDDLLKLFRIPFTILPTVYDSDSLFGATEFRLFGKNIPVHGIAGDQQASLFGQLGWDSNTVKVTYGTGIFMLANTGKSPLATDNLITTVAWKRNRKINYALEGSLFMGGASIQWLQENLGILVSPEESGSDTIADTTSDGVFFVPAFQGLGAPYWNPAARAQIIGMSRKADRMTLIRAAVESMAFQVRDVIEAMKPAGIPAPLRIRADGGASRNPVLMQFQADLLKLPVVCPAVSETTAYGVAGLAGIASGFWTEESFAATISEQREYTPAVEADNNPLDDLYAQWKKAVAHCLAWK